MNDYAAAGETLVNSKSTDSPSSIVTDSFTPVVAVALTWRAANSELIASSVFCEAKEYSALCSASADDASPLNVQFVGVTFTVTGSDCTTLPVKVKGLIAT